MGPPFSVFERSAPWKKSPIAERCSSNVNSTVCSRCSLSGTELRRFGEIRGEELLILFRQGFRVRDSRLPVSDSERKMKETCGRKQSGSFEKSRPVTLFLKMSQGLFPPDILDISCKTLPRQGTMRNGVCSERTMSELLIVERGFGFWPTPTVKGDYNKKGLTKKSGDGLATAVRMWPTPRACEGSHPPMGKVERHKGLTAKVKELHGGTKTPQKYPTPTATDSVKRGQVASRPGAMGLSEKMGGQLNPEWVGWLMAFPEGWTSLRPSGMRRFQEWYEKHGKS